LKKTIKTTSEDSHVDINVGETDNFVQINFEKDVLWVNMEPIQAIRVAERLKAAAMGILRKLQKPEE